MGHGGEGEPDINAGQVFTGSSGAASGTASTIYVTMDADQSMIADFRPMATPVAPPGALNSWNNTFSWSGVEGVTW